MSLYKNKYRVESARLKNWDYSSEGYYFITICIHNREQILGDIISDKMVLSDIGKIVEKEWLKSFEIRRELFCDTYCIMPNHIHGIVVINNDDNKPVETHGHAIPVQTHAVRLYKPINYNVCRNQYHHLWQDLNHRLQN